MKKRSGWLQVKQGFYSMLFTSSIFTATTQLIYHSSAVCLMGEMHRWNYSYKYHLSDI